MDRQQLEDVRQALRARITAGLARDGQEIKALPTWLGTPSADLGGEALVVDLGGTNMRAAHLALDGGGESRVLAGPVVEPVPDTRNHPMSGAAFFAAQARLVEALGTSAGLPLGYCFSFPAEPLPSRDAKLIRWTKEMEVSGVEGTLVGRSLVDALREKRPGRVTVLNDTVASLLGVAYARPELDHYIGLIVGTGTNMATFFPADMIGKVDPAGWQGPMAVNLESGNFSPPHLEAFDDQVDAASDNPGAQRFEKAVSGFYLPLLLGRVAGCHPPESAKALVELRDERPDSPAGRASAMLLHRSAQLVGAALAAVVDLLPSEGTVGILAEGSTIWKDPRYPETVRSTLRDLLGCDRCALLGMEDVNLVGAACAALLP